MRSGCAPMYGGVWACEGEGEDRRSTLGFSEAYVGFGTNVRMAKQCECGLDTRCDL